MRRSGLVLLATLACSSSDRNAQTVAAAADTVARDDSGVVRLDRPTVIAYFVIPPGAVDTMPNLAVEADDWNVSMATLGDSLDAAGIGFAMTTTPTLHVSIGGGTPTTLPLGQALTAGYVFYRPGAAPCVRQGGMDQSDVLALARSDTATSRCPTSPR